MIDTPTPEPPWCRHTATPGTGSSCLLAPGRDPQDEPQNSNSGVGGFELQWVMSGVDGPQNSDSVCTPHLAVHPGAVARMSS